MVISEITGKPHNDVMKAIRKMEDTWQKLDQGNFSLVSYLGKNGESRPMYELSKTECLYIATKFNDEARAKLVLRWQELETANQKPMSTLDMLQASIDAIRSNQQELTEVKQDIRELKARTQTHPDYFSIAGYATLEGKRIALKEAAQLGRKATSICSANGFNTESTPDPRFGRVKLYPKDVLVEVFNEHYGS